MVGFDPTLQAMEFAVKILSGHEVQTIVEYAKTGRFDLMVIGFSGYE